MAKSELGIKRTCLKCKVKFYDLNKEDIHCPECGTSVNETLESSIPDIEVLQDAVSPETSNAVVTEDSSDGTASIPDLIEIINNPLLEDNPIIIDDDDDDDDDIINDIDIPELDNDELINEDEDPFLVEEEDDDSEIIIKKQNDDE